jgi:uncharacterized protein (DUF433 family)
VRRRRWQIDLRPEDELTLLHARRALAAEGDSETSRALLGLFGRLVAAPHRWRKQLSIKGRRLTAGQLVFSMEANGDSIEDAAEDWDLSVEAFAEAADYVSRNRDLIEAEFAEECRRTEPFITHAPARR